MPDDVWVEHVARWLSHRDLARLAQTTRDFRRVAHAALLRHGLVLKHDACDVLAQSRWAGLRRVCVRGMPRRYVNHAPIPPLRVSALESLAHLERLELHHPRMPPQPVWPGVFAACAALRHVRLVGDFYMSNYAQDVAHGVDLVTCGAPRLTTLDVEGGWLVLHPTGVSPDRPDITAAIRRMHAAGPVPSATLRRYRMACQQVPVGVDAALDALEIEDSQFPPCAVGRMGPTTRARTRHLAWKTSWPAFDARILRDFAGLRTLDVHLTWLTRADRVSECLATLAGLPAGLRRLSLRVDAWVMPPDRSDVAWGRPLAALTSLEALHLELTFAPSTVEALLAGWMGAAPSVRVVSVAFRRPAAAALEDEIDKLLTEEGACSDDETVAELARHAQHANRPVADDGLRAWLEAHPQASARVSGLGHRFACSNPRCHVTAATSAATSTATSAATSAATSRP